MTSASYRRSIAPVTLAWIVSSMPYARTTAAPMTLSETSESISPTRVRAASNAADSRDCIEPMTTTSGTMRSTTTIESCQE